MQDPTVIVAQAKAGGIPPTWRVLRPTKGYPAKAALFGGFIALIAMFFLGVIGFMAAGVLAGSTLLNNPGSMPFDLQSLPYLVAAALAVVFLIAVLTGFYATSRVPFSYFVFTPEGAVQTIKAGKFMAIDYAALDLINTHITVNTTRNVDARTGATISSSSSVSISAELHYRDGRTRRWKPAARFGSGEAIVQRMINGLQEYKRMAGIPA